MGLLEAIFLGIIQGLTEFLPVSSSGHLAIFQKIFGMKGAGISFDVFLHLGTLLAVLMVYWKDILGLFVNGIGILADSTANIISYCRSRKNGKSPAYRKIVYNSYRKFALLVLVSTIPTGIIGILGKKLVSGASDTLIVPGICMLVTAILLFISDNVPDGDRTPKKTGYLQGVFMGICQGIATLPGLSRSGTTITAGLLCGLRRDFAVKYSFIMSVPAILGATLIEIPEMKQDITSNGALNYVVGMLLAAAVGYVCIRTMLIVVKNKKFKYFSYYCAIVGVIAVAASFFIQ